MKRFIGHSLILASFILCASGLSYGQSNPIPNAGFEDWFNGNPVGWLANNAPPILTTVTQSSTAHEGSSAIIGTTTTFMSAPFVPMISTGFPISLRYEFLTGWFTNSPTGGDSLLVEILIFKDDIVVGLGLFSSGSTLSAFTQFSAPITYSDATVVGDSAQILITSAPDGTPHIGSSFSIDHLSLDRLSAAGSETPATARAYGIVSNYPNPFNPTTTIRYSLGSEADVQLSLYDVTGRLVHSFGTVSRPAGTYEVVWTGDSPSGMYLCRMVATTSTGRQFTSSRRIALLR